MNNLKRKRNYVKRNRNDRKRNKNNGKKNLLDKLSTFYFHSLVPKLDYSNDILLQRFVKKQYRYGYGLGWI